jgi:hypothetical protein
VEEYIGKLIPIKLLSTSEGRSRELFGHIIDQSGSLEIVQVTPYDSIAYFLGLRTSIVRDVKQDGNKLILTTRNTVYTFEVLENNMEVK